MDVPREQYDSLLGGKEDLPSVISVVKFVNARCQEIAALTEAIDIEDDKRSRLSSTSTTNENWRNPLVGLTLRLISSHQFPIMFRSALVSSVTELWKLCVELATHKNQNVIRIPFVKTPLLFKDTSRSSTTRTEEEKEWYPEDSPSNHPNGSLIHTYLTINTTSRDRIDNHLSRALQERSLPSKPSNHLLPGFEKKGQTYRPEGLGPDETSLALDCTLTGGVGEHATKNPLQANWSYSVSPRSFIKAKRDNHQLSPSEEEPQNKHLAFQRMPKHLRRRAMSHNVKRMPRRLREVHLNQLEKSGLPIKGKRPSRKFRRRPSNLLQEYNRRAAAATWLETHIWHAKRFHMVKRWGYQLPQAPTNKGYRACYRASAKHCLLQDVSYLNCIELQGPEAKILRGLNQLTSPECGLTFAAKCTLDGMREGSVTLFRCGGYPSQAIGKVTFLWRPERDNSVRTIWIWSHPAFYQELLQELITVFQLKLEESNEMNVDANESEISESTSLLKIKRNVEKEKLTIRNDRKLPRYSNDTIVMVLMKNSLNRFRLTGPLAQVVLTEALKFVIVDDFVKPDTNTETMDMDDAEQPRSSWLCDFYKYDTRLQTLRKQCSFWENVLKNVNSASELSPGMVLSAVVMDPRLTMPSTRTKAVNSGVTNLQQEVPRSLSSHNPLWEFELRERVTDSKMSTSQLNGLRSRALVPGLASAAWLGSHNVSHLPILLVQNRGQYEQSGYGSGWDVIVPAGWGMPVWLGLVYRGARVGGLRETERLTLETVSGPTLPPDTEAGCLDSEQARSENYEKHFRYKSHFVFG
ncbi:Ribonucleases P/MRP protein subunit pop1 [Homalodisca vitripennis]|nr:Ribonucleases P/MRP protein subunit pop1 [Homalodisca vitripennis]